MLCDVPSGAVPPELFDARSEGGGPEGRFDCIVLSNAVFSSALIDPSPLVSILLNISSAFDVPEVDEVDDVEAVEEVS